MPFAEIDSPVPVKTAARPYSALIAPQLALSSCVRAYVTRSTVDVDLSPEKRHNYFPASPLCGMTWLLYGGATIVRHGDECVDISLPRVAFSGPHTVPVVSANPGPERIFALVLVPQSLQAMTGVDIAKFVNRTVPISAVLDPAWQAMALAVLNAPDDAARVHVVETFLRPRWDAVCHASTPRIDRYRYWVETLALRAASSGFGRSLRQVERRIKQWAGLPLRDLRRMARAEETFLKFRGLATDSANAAPDWSTVAVEGGFSDQSHFCRETRRISGLTPNELTRAVREEEGFWVYRLWALVGPSVCDEMSHNDTPGVKPVDALVGRCSP
jgi:AraC-like DNA-binding protein